MPNNDYILRSDAKKALTALPADLDAETVQRCIEAMNNPKAADVEPVVRCENCQFFENVEYWPDGTKKVCQLLKRQVLEKSFCCWGMKKEAVDG